MLLNLCFVIVRRLFTCGCKLLWILSQSRPADLYRSSSIEVTMLETQTQAEDGQWQTAVTGGICFVSLGYLCDILAALSEAFVLHCVWDEEEEGGIKL